MQNTEPDQRHMTPAKMVAVLDANIKAADQSWLRWTALGHEIIRRRHLASEQSNWTTRGPKYSAKLQTIMGVFYPRFKKLSDNGTLRALDECIAKLDQVNAFRNRLPEDQRPGHPTGVWRAYYASLASTIEFHDGDETGTDDPLEPPTPKASRKGHNSDKAALLRQIALLEERLDEQRLTSHASTNADRIMRRLVEERGSGHQTAQLIIETADELRNIGLNLSEEPSE